MVQKRSTSALCCAAMSGGYNINGCLVDKTLDDEMSQERRGVN